MFSDRHPKLYSDLKFTCLFSSFIVGCFILWGGVWCGFEELIYEMCLQVAPPREWILDTVLSIILYAFFGGVLILFPIVELGEVL